MGNAAAVQSVGENSRRRLMLQQYNRQPRNVLIAHSLTQAFAKRHFQSLRMPRLKQVGQVSNRNEQLEALPLHEIYDVLKHEFGVQLTIEELPFILRHLGCQVVQPLEEKAINLDSGEEWYSLQELVEYVAPRRILRRQCSHRLEFSHNNVTIWQAAKMGNLAVVEAVCGAHGEAYRALDDFGNSPLYYASLCGHEVVVNFVLEAYERECLKIPPDELLRCLTNALNQHTRALLQQKMTLKDVLKQKERIARVDDEVDGDSAWFGLLACESPDDKEICQTVDYLDKP